MEDFRSINSMAKILNMPSNDLKKIINVFNVESKVLSYRYDFIALNKIYENLLITSKLYGSDTKCDFYKHIDTQLCFRVYKKDYLGMPSINGGYVYILKIHTKEMNNIVKIGSSSNVESRIKTLNENWEYYEVRFELLKVSKFLENALDIEKSIHKILKSLDMQVIPNIELDGYTEIFKYEDWITNMI